MRYEMSLMWKAALCVALLSLCLLCSVTATEADSAHEERRFGGDGGEGVVVEGRSREEIASRFLQWLKKRGVEIDESRVELVASQDSPYLAVEWRLKVDVDSDTTLLRFPLSHIISVPSAAKEIPTFGKDISFSYPEEVLIAWFMYQAHLGEFSEYAPFIESYLSIEDAVMPIFFLKEDFEAPTYYKIKRMADESGKLTFGDLEKYDDVLQRVISDELINLRAAYDLLNEELFSQDTVQYPPDSFAFEDYVWAWSCVMSSSRRATGELLTLLIPGLDVLSHSNSGISVSFNSEGENFPVVSPSALSAGAVLKENRFPYDTLKSFIYFGIVPEIDPLSAHPNDCVTLPVVGVANSTIWKDHVYPGLCSTYPVFCRSNMVNITDHSIERLCLNIDVNFNSFALRLLRLASLDQNDFDGMSSLEPLLTGAFSISITNEFSAFRVLMSMVRYLIWELTSNSDANVTPTLGEVQVLHARPASTDYAAIAKSETATPAARAAAKYHLWEVTSIIEAHNNVVALWDSILESNEVDERLANYFKYFMTGAF